MLLVTLYVMWKMGGAELTAVRAIKRPIIAYFFCKISEWLLKLLEMKSSAHCQHCFLYIFNELPNGCCCTET